MKENAEWLTYESSIKIRVVRREKTLYFERINIVKCVLRTKIKVKSLHILCT